MRTEDLIEAMSRDAGVRWPLGRGVTLAILAGTALAAALFFAALGFRPDIAQALRTVRFPFKFVLTVTLAVTALGLVLRMSRPGAAPGPWRLALAAVPVLLGAAVAAELYAMPEASWGPRLVGHNALLCTTSIPALAVGPLACLMAALRRGAPARPGLTGAVAGLAASGLAATLYASHCPDDSPLFVATWYPLGIVLVVAAAYGIGRRWLRW